MSKHSKGPWSIDIRPKGVSVILGPDVPSSEEIRMRLYSNGDPGDDDYAADQVVIANAMLMAAAPDLLEACKELFEMATEGDPHELIGWAGAVDKARAAIAKATGN